MNRPGLDALAYRVGTHAAFLETMKARLSNMVLEIPDMDDPNRSVAAYPLQSITTRAPDDASIAMLDAWAMVGDVLTFYQERIANEGYLRTATERRSILELARLVGYALRPGVAASTYLALELDRGQDVMIQPYEIKAQSTPGPGEQPQTFENIDPLDARFAWNKLQPRLTQPQTITSIAETNASENVRLYVKGVNANLASNDVVLITRKDQPYKDKIFHVAEARPEPEHNRTLVIFREKQEPPTPLPLSFVHSFLSRGPLQRLMTGLTKRGSVPPRNAFRLKRDPASLFATNGDIGLKLASTFDSRLARWLPVALGNVNANNRSDIRVYAFRATARPFGHNAPLRAIVRKRAPTKYREWIIDDPLGEQPEPASPHRLATLDPSVPPRHDPLHLYLDGEYEIKSDGWIIIKGPAISPGPHFINLTKLDTPVQLSLAAYGISGKTTLLVLPVDKAWLLDSSSFSHVRATVVYAESEELTLAEEPIEEPIGGGASESIELATVYSGLQSGRWLIVSGERDEILDEEGSKVRGVRSAELVMLAEVLQQTRVTGDSDRSPGDRTHTFIKLAAPLEYSYRRESVTIYGNVVKATHGETRRETLGSGDASLAFQSFILKQAPLTFNSSPTPAGMESTLKIYVNDMQWREANCLGDLGKTDRNFITKTDDDGKTTVIFGNGQRGARLPSGFENIRAVYRSGMGRLGNVRAEQISMLQSKPLGVQGVKNPLRASGGAETESRDAARKNAPLTVTALDRLVSIRDYADFSRTFAGVGKAFAMRLTDGRRELVHVTIAGAEDIPIDETSDLHRNLLKALRDLGDPHQPIALQVRELKLIVLGANVRILPDHEWEPVVKAIRSTLLDVFSFERRELGQDVLLNELVAAIHSVRGVAYVDVDVFGSIPEKKTHVEDNHPRVRRLLTRQEIAEEAKKFLDNSKKSKRPETRVRVNLAGFEHNAMHPAQLAYLTPDIADTLVLNQIQ